MDLLLPGINQARKAGFIQNAITAGFGDQTHLVQDS